MTTWYFIAMLCTARASLDDPICNCMVVNSLDAIDGPTEFLTRDDAWMYAHWWAAEYHPEVRAPMIEIMEKRDNG